MAISISSNYYSGYSARRASMNSEWFREYAKNMNQTKPTGSGFDYGAAIGQASALASRFESQVKESTQLRKDSAEFLKTYSKDMKTMESAANALMGSNLDKLIGQPDADGKLSEEKLKKTTDAVQTMVDTYNNTLKNLNNNADRGSGVMQQISRMAADPTTQQNLNLVGVSVQKDGSLKLDAAKLTGALTGAAASDAKTATTNRMRELKTALGGTTGLAAGVQLDARRGQTTSAASLIENDLAKLQQQSLNNPMTQGYLYNRSGAYNMMNMGTIGVLMNMIG